MLIQSGQATYDMPKNRLRYESRLVTRQASCVSSPDLLSYVTRNASGPEHGTKDTPFFTRSLSRLVAPCGIKQCTLQANEAIRRAYGVTLKITYSICYTGSMVGHFK